MILVSGWPRSEPERLPTMTSTKTTKFVTEALKIANIGTSMGRMKAMAALDVKMAKAKLTNAERLTIVRSILDAKKAG